MFIIGTIIFVLYMVGYLTMITKMNKLQSKENKVEKKRIILNRIMTPDGTIIKSMHHHDYVTHVDKNGLQYMVDGGHSYLRRNVHETKLTPLMKVKKFLLGLIGKTLKDPLAYTELTIYEDAPFEVIREHFHRGGRGKDGCQPLTWVPMSEMNNSWLKACITYNEDIHMGDSFANKMYKAELEYREKNGIFIEDVD